MFHHTSPQLGYDRQADVQAAAPGARSHGTAVLKSYVWLRDVRGAGHPLPGARLEA